MSKLLTSPDIQASQLDDNQPLKPSLLDISMHVQTNIGNPEQEGGLLMASESTESRQKQTEHTKSFRPWMPQQMLPSSLMMSDSYKRDELIPSEHKRECFMNVSSEDAEVIYNLLDQSQGQVSQLQSPTDITQTIKMNQGATELSKQPAIACQYSVESKHSDDIQQMHRSDERKERPDKNMKKILFTPFKRLLKCADLRDKYGVDTQDYFEVCPNTPYGHRTWMDFEVIFWFVQEKYKHEPAAFGQYITFLNENRKIMERHGLKRYGKPQYSEWLDAYKKCLDSIYKAVNEGATSKERLAILYGKRSPSESALVNLENLQKKFIQKGKINESQPVQPRTQSKSAKKREQPKRK